MTAGRSTTIRQSLEYKHCSKLHSQFEIVHSVWTTAALEFFPDYLSAEQSESVKRRSPPAKLDSALLSIWTINPSRPRCLQEKKDCSVSVILNCQELEAEVFLMDARSQVLSDNTTHGREMLILSCINLNEVSLWNPRIRAAAGCNT